MKIRTNILLLRQLIAKDWLLDYCYWLRFKYQFGNSCYFAYTINGIARHNGISHNCAKKYISLFIRRGWCRQQDGNLTFVNLQKLLSIEELQGRHTFNIETDISNSKILQVHLQRIVFEDTLRQQQFVIEKKQDLNNPRNMKQFRSARKAAGEYASITSTGAIVSDYIMTNSWMSRIFNFSKASAQRLKQVFQLNGWFSFIRRFSTIARNVTGKAFKTGILPLAKRNLFLYKGYVMRSEPSLVLIHI